MMVGLKRPDPVMVLFEISLASKNVSRTALFLITQLTSRRTSVSSMYLEDLVAFTLLV